MKTIRFLITGICMIFSTTILIFPLKEFGKILNIQEMTDTILFILIAKAFIFSSALFWTDEPKNQKVLDILKIDAAGSFSLLLIIVPYVNSILDSRPFKIGYLQLDENLFILYKCFLILTIFIACYIIKIFENSIMDFFSKKT